MLKRIKVYADTTVFGGIVDEEFTEDSRTFFEQVRQGRFLLVTSPLVEQEIAGAPEIVRDLFEEMSIIAEIVSPSEESRALGQAYIDAGVVTARSATDALHVALATVGECSLVVSWNFKHIVQYRKIQKYNAVNQLNGYTSIAIHNPREVIDDEG